VKVGVAMMMIKLDDDDGSGRASTKRSAKQACFVFEKIRNFFPPKTYQRYHKDIKHTIHSMKRGSSAQFLIFIHTYIWPRGGG
jgi:hypothetical protein